MCVPFFFVGHDKPVSSVSWSLNRQWWLSASEDRSLRIWSHGGGEPAIIVVNAVCSVAAFWATGNSSPSSLIHAALPTTHSPLHLEKKKKQRKLTSSQAEWPHPEIMSFQPLTTCIRNDGVKAAWTHDANSFFFFTTNTKVNSTSAV